MLETRRAAASPSRPPPDGSEYLAALPCFFLAAGDYEVSIKFNNEHIPDSPFIVPIATLSDEARRLTFTSLQVR